MNTTTSSTSFRNMHMKMKIFRRLTYLQKHLEIGAPVGFFGKQFTWLAFKV